MMIVIIITSLHTSVPFEAIWWWWRRCWWGQRRWIRMMMMMLNANDFPIQMKPMIVPTKETHTNWAHCLSPLTFLSLLVDVDECKTGACGEGAICTNLPGSFECTCPTGFKGNPRPEIGCVDVDECLSTDRQLCGTNATCVNTVGGYFCQCPQGFTGNSRISCTGKSTLSLSLFPHLLMIHGSDGKVTGRQ